MSDEKTLSADAFDEIYLQYYTRLKHYALQILSRSLGRYDPQLAEDAVQDTFRTLWEKPSKYLSSPSPEGWLFQTLSYVIKNQLRKEVRLEKLVLKLQDTFDRSPAPPPGAHLELEGHIAPEECRLLYRLYIAGDSYEEVAREMGITKMALAKRVGRIKEKFRKNYLESENFSEKPRQSRPSAVHDIVEEV